MAHSSRTKAKPSGKGMSISNEVPASAAASLECRGIDPDARHPMILCAAYHRAEQRGFSGDGALADCLAAEHEVNGLLQAPRVNDASEAIIPGRSRRTRSPL